MNIIRLPGSNVGVFKLIIETLKTLARIAKCQNGSIAIVSALVIPVLMGAAALTMDFAFMRLKHTELQNAADAAALAAARELSVAINSNSYIHSVVKAHVAGNFQDSPNLSVSSKVEGKKDIVVVELSLKWSPFFAQYFNSSATPLIVKAKAKLAGVGKICVLGLVPKTMAGIHLDNKSKLYAKNCGIFSNSETTDSLRADSNAKGVANIFCAAGGFRKSGSSSLYPRPQTDCPHIPDPLSARAKPANKGMQL